MQNCHEARAKLKALQASAELCTEDSPQQDAAPLQDQRRFRVQVIQSIEDVRTSFYLENDLHWQLSKIVYLLLSTGMKLAIFWQVDSAEWNAAAIGSGEVNPFVLHGFLQSLESSSSAACTHFQPAVLFKASLP